MQRVKVLGGLLSAGQWRSLGQIARRFTPTTPLHLTTRQEVELHDLLPEAVPEVQRHVAQMGLTGLGACGDTLRNVTVCPCSGTLAGVVDLLPLAWQLRRMLEAHEGILSLPRKFKISLSACEPGCGQPWINDLGLVASRRDGRWGFRVAIAGSLGPQPETGMPLFDWIAPKEVLPLVLASIRVFQAHGDRQRRSRARLRHVRQRVGDARFAEMIRTEMDKVRGERPWPNIQLQEVAEGFPARRILTFPNGDVTAPAAEALAELAGLGDLAVRIANHHRVILFGRDDEALGRAISALPALAGPARPQASVVACPGKRWCNRALTETNGLAGRIREELGGKLPPETTVCVSGCPNGCAHSAVADIGLTGALARRNGRQREVFNLFAGGGMGRSNQLARPVARELQPPDALEQISRLAEGPCGRDSAGLSSPQGRTPPA